MFDISELPNEMSTDWLRSQCLKIDNNYVLALLSHSRAVLACLFQFDSLQMFKYSISKI